MLSLRLLALIVAQWLPAVASEDTLPPGAIARLGSRQMRTATWIRSLSFSPDSRWLLAVQEKLTQIWDIHGNLLHNIENNRFKICCHQSTCTGKLIMLGFDEDDLQIREMEPGRPKEVRKLTIRVPLAVRVRDVHACFNNNGTRLGIVYSAGARVRMLDTANGNVLWELTCNGQSSYPPVFSEDGKRLFLAYRSHVEIYERDTGKLVRLLKNDNEHAKISSPILSMDGKRLALTDSNSEPRVLVWDCDTGKLVRAYKGNRPIGFLPNNHDLMVATQNQIAVYDEATGKCLREFEVPYAEKAILSPDGKWLADRARDAILIHDAQTGVMMPCSANPPGVPNQLRFTPDNHLIGELIGWNGWVHWNGKDPRGHLTRLKETGDLESVAISNDLCRALYRSPKKISLIDIKTDKIIYNIELPIAKQVPTMVKLAADGKTVLLATAKGLQIHRPEKDIKTIVWPHASRGITASALSLNAKWALLFYLNIDEGISLEVVDLEAQNSSYVFPFAGAINAAHISQDGRVFMVLASPDLSSKSEYRVIDRESKRVLWKSPFRVEYPLNEDFTLASDGRSVILTHGSEICTYEICTGQLRSKIPYKGDIWSMALSPDGKTLATSSLTTGPVLLWDLLGDKARSLRAPGTAAEYASALETLASENAEDAYRAARRLALGGDAAVSHLLRKVPPVTAPDPVRVAALIRELDSDEFAVRERASHELIGLSRVIAPTLKRAIPTASLEVRTRIDRILESFDDRGSSGNRMAVRTVEVLEWIGSPMAREALRKMAEGAPGTTLTREAEAAEQRLQSTRPN